MAEIRRADFTVDWKFEKEMLTLNPESFHRYNFFLADLQNTAWELRMCLIRKFVYACIDRRKEDNYDPKEVEIECDFNLLFLQEDPYALRSFRGNSPGKIAKKSFKVKDTSGFVTIISRSAIDALKDEDMLLLRFRLWSRDSSSFLHPVNRFVRSPGEYRESFSWTVNDFSSLQRGNRVCYALPKKHENSKSLTFDLFLDDDNDRIFIEVNSTRVTYCILSISVVDANGGKSIYLQDSYRSIKGPKKILHVLKSKLLEDKEKFLPNNQLTLYFDVRRGFILEKVIIGDYVEDNEHPVPNRGHSSHAGRNLYNLQSEGLLTDFELRIESQTLRVHKNILAARSPVFLAMLTNEMRESTQQAVDIEDLEMDTVKHLVDFMYLDSIPKLDWNSVLKLYSAANKYDVEGLKNKCSEILKSKLCVENVCPILSLADTHSDANLKQFVLEFILQNESRVILSQEWENFIKEDINLGPQVTLYLYRKRIETKQ